MKKNYYVSIECIGEKIFAKKQLIVFMKGRTMGNTDKLFKEYNITKSEQKSIMDVMDKYRALIADEVSVTHAQYEKDIIDIFGGDFAAMHHVPAIEYHFCEYVAKSFMEEHRWEEVFFTLYGEFPKYGGKIE